MDNIHQYEASGRYRVDARYVRKGAGDTKIHNPVDPSIASIYQEVQLCFIVRCDENGRGEAYQP